MVRKLSTTYGFDLSCWIAVPFTSSENIAGRDRFKRSSEQEVYGGSENDELNLRSLILHGYGIATDKA